MSGARLYLVRHGQAAAGFAVARDPGLDVVGRQQAEAMAAAMAPRGPLALVVSPMRRTRETAAALEQVWSTTGRIEPRVAEVITPDHDSVDPPADPPVDPPVEPPGDPPGDRGVWIRRLMQSTWSAEPAALQAWRADVLAALGELTRDCVVVSHFVAINVAVGAATGDDRITVFRPDNCAITVLDRRDGALHLVELGREQQTRVL